jgi:4-amino-4-deoxy-L-arabinose transferase-like glycosyltransferase
LLLITTLAAALRFWGLDRIPAGFHYDEAYEALEAWQVLTRPGYHPIFFPGNFGVEPLFIYLTSLAFWLFGQTPTVMRGVAALVGTLTVPIVYAAAAELARADERIPPALPLLAAAVMATMRWHIHFSRVGIEPVLVPLFLALILWVLWRGRRTNGLGAWIILGVVVGLTPYTYPAGRLLPVVAVVMVLWQGKVRRGPLLAAFIAALVFAPLAWNWAQHPDQLFLRSSQIAVGAEDAGPGLPARNLLASLAMFSFQGDADPRNNVPGLPVLDVLMSVPFYLGLALALWLWRRPAFGGLLFAAAVMLAPTVFSEYAPHFRRALGLTPVIALLCGLGLATLLGRRGERSLSPKLVTGMDALRRLGQTVIVAVILLGSTISGANAYFNTWGRSNAIYYAYDQGLWEIGQYVLDLPTDERVYLTPRPAGDMTLAFAWREGRAVRHFDGRHAFVAPAFAPGPATYIVIEHEDFRGGRLLRELYPQARGVKTFLDRDGKIYARIYRILDTKIPDLSRSARPPKFSFAGGWPNIELIGYDLDRPGYQPGEIVYLQLWWRATGKVATDWTVFTHLLGPPKADGSTLWAGHDARPGQGSAGVTTWVPGDLILDEYQLRLPSNAPPGQYQIEIGLYNPAAGGTRATTSSPPGQDYLILGTITVQ